MPLRRWIYHLRVFYVGIARRHFLFRPVHRVSALLSPRLLPCLPLHRGCPTPGSFFNAQSIFVFLCFYRYCTPFTTKTRRLYLWPKQNSSACPSEILHAAETSGQRSALRSPRLPPCPRPNRACRTVEDAPASSWPAPLVWRRRDVPKIGATSAPIHPPPSLPSSPYTIMETPRICMYEGRVSSRQPRGVCTACCGWKLAGHKLLKRIDFTQ